MKRLGFEVETGRTHHKLYYGGDRSHPREVARDHSTAEPQQWYSDEPPAPTRRPLTVELNSADTTTLMLLHGIGPAFARRIVRYRDRLGGFVATEQLLEVYGFTPELLAHIAPHLALDSTIRSRLPVNSIPLKQFIKHPYVDYYFARDLVNLRSVNIAKNQMLDLPQEIGNDMNG